MSEITEAIKHLEHAKEPIIKLVDYPEENGERSDMIRDNASAIWDYVIDALIILKKL